MTQALAPINGSTVNISVTSTSSSTALTVTTGTVLILTNTGSKHCFVRQGITTTTALTSDLIVRSLSQISVAIENGTTHLAAICAGSDTTTLYVSNAYGDLIRLG